VNDLVLTLDVNIIMIGTGMSNIACQPYHLDLLESFKSIVYLALDQDGHILQLYDHKLGSASLGKIWLTSILKNGRYKKYPLGLIDAGTKSQLDKEHLDPDDRKYIRLAISTQEKYFVTEDDDFTVKICKILRKRLGVIVLDAESAHSMIHGI
jgi:hypothetical protein